LTLTYYPCAMPRNSGKHSVASSPGPSASRCGSPPMVTITFQLEGPSEVARMNGLFAKLCLERHREPDTSGYASPASSTSTSVLGAVRRLFVGNAKPTTEAPPSRGPILHNGLTRSARRRMRAARAEARRAQREDQRRLNRVTAILSDIVVPAKKTHTPRDQLKQRAFAAQQRRVELLERDNAAHASQIDARVKSQRRSQQVRGYVESVAVRSAYQKDTETKERLERVCNPNRPRYRNPTVAKPTLPALQMC